MSWTSPGFWIEILVALLLIAGGFITLIGSLGLLRLRDFFQRMHGPAMGNTMGAICILIASLIYFSISRHQVLLHEVLIVLFLLMTAPVTGMLLARAALYRQHGESARPIGASPSPSSSPSPSFQSDNSQETP